MSLPALWQSMNKTCGSTATNPVCRWSFIRRAVQGTAALALFALVCAGCTPIRPVAKIGLIAPFEGLYRETGYQALDALRLAIDMCAASGMDVLPLALDDSNRPAATRRAAAKLMVDPAVMAVIGPYSLEGALAAAPVLAPSPVEWLAPFMVDDQGRFAAPAGDPQWLAALIAAVAVAAEAEGAQRLAVAGIPQAWLDPIAGRLAASAPSIPVRLANLDAGDAADLGDNGALLWLGEPQQGARLQATLHADQPDAAFWMGPQSTGPVFSALTTGRGPIYWVTWVTPQYNITLLQPDLGSPAAFLTYAAACQALQNMSGGSTAPMEPLHLQVNRLMQDGTGRPVLAEPQSR